MPDSSPPPAPSPATTPATRNPYCTIPGCDCQNGPPIARCDECQAATPHHALTCSHYESGRGYGARVSVPAPAAPREDWTTIVPCTVCGGAVIDNPESLANRRHKLCGPASDAPAPPRESSQINRMRDRP